MFTLLKIALILGIFLMMYNVILVCLRGGAAVGSSLKNLFIKNRKEI
jgi:hypothetical protein